MSVYSEASFSVNQYDNDGDVVDECILVHVGDTILRFSTISQLDGFAERLQSLSKEIKKNY
ncbi:hypothetical protein J41TS12_17660 [Paenibacillus antibioticophila]|uniref:Uncharacterized protein n=1 Tax=Paenibacillus antibioticophila TaxID=1274374 RepID=A0A919XV08_9BACL|nr:hypothetical protein J41TS12_17660 [Paenibacillus antibioticophila]